ncbi:MAG: hypothetical protein FWG30_06265 [Eubacteriaceae bacterium]|nr:hypothetical protein [Eubacteriaceae bacterium]
MTIPIIPEISNGLTLDSALSSILMSIAYEEIALAHIINAEAEKLQYALGTLHEDCQGELTAYDAIRINESVHSVLQQTVNTVLILNNKLDDAISFGCHQKQARAEQAASGFSDFAH